MKKINNIMLKKNYLFIIIFTFAVFIRLWKINNPLLDEHSWRQTTSAMVARNYLKDMNLFKPQTDFQSPYPFVFGLYEYSVACLAKIFGYSDVLGRLTSLSFFILGFIYFYKLVKKYLGERASLFALTFYTFLPTSVFYSRSFQVDGPMTSLSIVFIFYFGLWVEQRKRIHFLLSVIVANVLFMFKISSLYMIIAAILYLYSFEGIKFIKNPKLYIFLILSMAFPIFFNQYVPVMEANKGKIFSPLGGWILHKDTLLSFDFWYKTFFANLFEYQYMHTGYIFFVIGLFQHIKDARYRLFHVWLISIIAFFIVAAYGMHHEYYLVVLIPVACVFIGSFLSDFFQRYRERMSTDKNY